MECGIFNVRKVARTIQKTFLMKNILGSWAQLLEKRFAPGNYHTDQIRFVQICANADAGILKIGFF